TRECGQNAATGRVMRVNSKQVQHCLAAQTVGEQWRWRRDLNPRTGLPVTRFRGVLLRPLGHATAWQLTGPQRRWSNRHHAVAENHGVTNRIQSLLDVESPVIQAPMTYIARAELAAAVSEGGGMGMIETLTAEGRADLRRVRELTDRPVAANLMIQGW